MDERSKLLCFEVEKNGVIQKLYFDDTEEGINKASAELSFLKGVYISPAEVLNMVNVGRYQGLMK